jgi:hypothetical protein
VDLSQLGTAGDFVERHGLAIFLVLAFVMFFALKIWPAIIKGVTTVWTQFVEANKASLELNKEVSKNMAEGNVIISNIAPHMASTVSAIEKLSQRLELSDAKIEERHRVNLENNAKMYDMWADIHKAVTQNSGDIRQALQKHESGERARKKSLKAKEVLA